MMISIDRNNYEEYFLLYLDNELGEAERLAVEQFAAGHQDLAAELELLGRLRLSPEADTCFGDKSGLMKELKPVGPVNEANFEEYFLLYTDHELSPGAGRELEAFLAANPQLEPDFKLLQQARLAPDQDIVFPDKSILYREERRVTGMRWWRPAAAAAVVLMVGTAWWALSGKKSGNMVLSELASPLITTPVAAAGQPAGSSAAGILSDNGPALLLAANGQPIIPDPGEEDADTVAAVKMLAVQTIPADTSSKSGMNVSAIEADPRVSIVTPRADPNKGNPPLADTDPTVKHHTGSDPQANAPTGIIPAALTEGNEEEGAQLNNNEKELRLGPVRISSESRLGRFVNRKIFKNKKEDRNVRIIPAAAL